MSELLLISCKITRGGFTSERNFEIELAEGGRVVGIANVQYLFDENKRQLDDNIPDFEESISGFVQCRKIRGIDESTILVEVPSADVLSVPEKSLEMA